MSCLQLVSYYHKSLGELWCVLCLHKDLDGVEFALDVILDHSAIVFGKEFVDVLLIGLLALAVLMVDAKAEHANWKNMQKDENIYIF